MKKKIRRISKIVEGVLPEITVEGITNKKGNIRKTVHQFDRLFDGSFCQVREQLILETTWMGNYEPFTIETVDSYIYNLMQRTEQEALIKKYDLQPFKVQALSVERTFCEKIMSLVRFSRVEDPLAALSNKIRHVYDLDQILVLFVNGIPVVTMELKSEFKQAGKMPFFIMFHMIFQKTYLFILIPRP